MWPCTATRNPTTSNTAGEHGEHKLPAVRVGNLQPAGRQQHQQEIPYPLAEEETSLDPAEGASECLHHFVSSSRCGHLQMQHIAGRLNPRLVHGLHVGRADGKASRIHHLEQIERFVATA